MKNLRCWVNFEDEYDIRVKVQNYEPDVEYDEDGRPIPWIEYLMIPVGDGEL